jgi:8-oxo-dGTP pyrophosphatase MutT (NUDIX family)
VQGHAPGVCLWRIELARRVSVPRIPDPRAVPAVGSDDHLPALSPEHLSPHAIRRRFVDAGYWQAPIPGDGGLRRSQPVPASVLVPLVHREDGLHVLLTRRTDHLRDHAGQISFPGGRSEPGDPDAVATALREAHEEVGLPPELIDPIGSLPTYTTVTHFVVTPVIALVRPDFEVRLDAFEVAEVFEVPLAFLMSPANHRRHRFPFDGGERQFLSMPWRRPTPEGGEVEYFIWGATAAMLRNLYHFLAR